MTNFIVYVLGLTILSLVSSPALGQRDENNSNGLFGMGSLFGDAPLKDIGLDLGAKENEDDRENEIEKMAFESPLAKILALQDAQNGEGDDNELDIDVDEEAIEFMKDIARKVPASVEKMIEELPLTDSDLQQIEGVERIVENLIGREMQRDILMTQMERFPDVLDEDEEEEEAGVVDYGGVFGNGAVLGGAGGLLGGSGGRRWGRRNGRLGGGLGGRFRQEQQQRQQKQQQQQEEVKEESGERDGGRRVLRRKKQQDQQQNEEAETEKPRRIASTIGRARSGIRAAGVTRENFVKAAEFTAENAYKTAMGLGGVMIDMNDELTDVVSNIDFDPINDAATKTAGLLVNVGKDAATKTASFMVDMAERNVPGDIVQDLLTTSQGNPLETVRSVLLHSKRPEAMMPIVEEVSGNYVKVIKKVTGEMDGFLRMLFSAPAALGGDEVEEVMKEVEEADVEQA